ncbi:MAG: metallophosphoesterase [Desulfococcaceae bacterium]
MKILYTTDLHGAAWKYDRLFDLACAHRPDAVVNGGDMLPYTHGPSAQSDFIRGKLRSHFAEFDAIGVDYLCHLGNDDLRIWDGLFAETCGAFHGVHDIAQNKAMVAGIEFIGMNWVADYPFRLKDRCRLDTPNGDIPPQMGSGLLSTHDGWHELDDWRAYAASLPTLADELAALAAPSDPAWSVYVFHMPPSKLGLDVCHDGREVGSAAIYDFLAERRPRLSLHGHIHESPEISGAWKADLDRTTCVQPGQCEEDCLIYVTVDTDSMEMERHKEKR